MIFRLMLWTRIAYRLFFSFMCLRCSYRIFFNTVGLYFVALYLLLLKLIQLGYIHVHVFALYS